MPKQESELLEELQSILEQNGNVPPRVTNRLVLAAVREIYKISMTNSNDIQSLKVKASLWGAASGLVATIGTILLALILRGGL
jgi:hypothetical protein